MQLWDEFAKGGVLIAPGWFFSADQETIPDGKYEGHYRISFSTATVRVCLRWKLQSPDHNLTRNLQFPEMERAIDILAEVMKVFLNGE